MWLHCTHVCVCTLVGLDWPLTKWVHSNISRWWNVTRMLTCTRPWEQAWASCGNEHEWLLPDCRVDMKESESEDDLSWMHWQHARQLTFWTMIRVWQSHDKAGYEWAWWPSDSRMYSGFKYVRSWYDRSYLAWIPLLVHGLTVNLSPCPCSHSSLAGWIAACQCGHFKCNLPLAQAHPRMIQYLSSIYNLSLIPRPKED